MFGHCSGKREFGLEVVLRHKFCVLGQKCLVLLCPSYEAAQGGVYNLDFSIGE